jgi:beta-alanine--pyruvate transaminase
MGRASRRRPRALVALHDASTIAAVIVEPMAGSTGVLPPPKGYLKKLREICDKHGILLIFDEVITGFGRLGYRLRRRALRRDPRHDHLRQGRDLGRVPMGGVFARKHIYDAFMNGPDNVIELFHGYTYSGHPLACAAGMATLDLYRDEGLFERAKALAPGAGKRGYDVFVKAYEKGLMVRLTGDTIALSPPLILTKKHIDDIFGILKDAIQSVN